jgi:uncharacterized repeat protein (TIGR03803 family)
LILDSSGNVYGTTLEGGKAESDNCGTVYSLIPARAGWTEKIIYTFCSQGGDGYFPASGLIADQTGNLYGTTSSGGNDLGGTIFELSPGANGWTWSLLRGLCQLLEFADVTVLAGSLPQSFHTAEVGGIQLDQRGIELMLADELAEAIADGATATVPVAIGRL